MSDNLISIVMPAYQAELTLDLSIQSVCAQTWGNWEILLVVDGSTDATLAMARAWEKKDPRIRVFHNERNMGVAASRNRALDEAKGQYITFLDSDDWWMPEKLSIQINFMLEVDAKLSYTAYQRWGKHGLINTVIPPGRVTYDRMLKGSVIAIMTGMLHRDLADQVRFRNIGHEDFLFWLQALRKIPYGSRVPTTEPTAVYRIQENSRSANLVRNAGWQWGIYRRELSLPLIKSCVLMGYYFQQALSKRLRRREYQKN